MAPAAHCASNPAPAPRGVRPAPAEQAPVRTEGRLTLGALGDVLMHGAVKESAALHRDSRGGDEDGYTWLYAEVADLLSAPDLTFANLESPIAPTADRGSRSYVFNAPPAAARALRAAGVDLVSVANNHAFDQGRAGFLETLRRLDEAGLAWVGAGTPPAEAGPRLIEVNGLRLAFLAWSRFFNDEGNTCAPTGPCLRAALLDPERAPAAVRQAVASADAVVVSLHWGEEYAAQPRPDDVELARRLAEAGALVVLGHHPHVLQPLELYRCTDGRLSVIAYSLGNFVSNQSRYFVSGVTPDRAGATRDGALLRVTLARRDYGRGVRRVEVAGVDFLPLWTENDAAEIDARRDPGARASIRVVSLDRALRAVRTELDAMPDPVPEAERARWVRLRQRERLYLSRRQAIAAVLGEDLQAEAPPAPTAAATGQER
ncbi:MAG TPA: CapA family protein [Anaeromyxobacteraceae bacterium]|nr:CapA family protein [Anaeromyxobacteraceae bacterium]